MKPLNVETALSSPRGPFTAIDAGRSSKALVQKTHGLRWMSLALLAPAGWTARVWALPLLTALCPSERYGPYLQRGRRHKPLAERARGLIGQARRWLPDRALIVVTDAAYAALDLLAWCRQLPQPVTIITRLRVDAALYEPPPVRQPGQQGRPRVRGRRLPTLARRLDEPDTVWRKLKVNWYGAKARWLWVCSDTALWYHGGGAPRGHTLGTRTRPEGAV